MEPGQFLGGRLAGLADAHGEQPAVERFGAGAGARLDHLGGILLAEAARFGIGAEVQVGELLGC